MSSSKRSGGNGGGSGKKSSKSLLDDSSEEEIVEDTATGPILRASSITGASKTTSHRRNVSSSSAHRGGHGSSVRRTATATETRRDSRSKSPKERPSTGVRRVATTEYGGAGFAVAAATGSAAAGRRSSMGTSTSTTPFTGGVKRGTSGQQQQQSVTGRVGQPPKQNKTNLLMDDDSDLSDSDDEQNQMGRAMQQMQMQAHRQVSPKPSHSAVVDLDFLLKNSGGKDDSERSKKTTTFAPTPDPVFAFDDPLAPPKFLQQDFSLGVATVAVDSDEDDDDSDKKPSPGQAQGGGSTPTKTGKKNMLEISFSSFFGGGGGKGNQGDAAKQGGRKPSFFGGQPDTEPKKKLGSTALAGYGKKYQVDQSTNLMDTETGAKQPYRRSGNQRRRSKQHSQHQALGFGDSLANMAFDANMDGLSPLDKRRALRSKLVECLLIYIFPLVLVGISVPIILHLVWPKVENSKIPHATRRPTGAPTAAPGTSTSTQRMTEAPTSESALGEAVAALLPQDNASNALLDLVEDEVSTGLDMVQRSFKSGEKKGKAFGQQQAANATNGTLPTPPPKSDNSNATHHDHPATHPPGLSIANDERWRALKGLIVRKKLSSEEDFFDTESSAYKALEWIVTYDKNLQKISSDTAWSILENYALTVFYFATHPDIEPDEADNPTNTTGGNNTEATIDWIYQTHLDICEWHGIECGNHRVVAMNLTQSALAGTLPSELVGLKNLIELDLSRNEIAGTLPPEWSKLSLLKYLTLADNQLTGPFPESWQDLSDQLDLLDLSQNQITGVISLNPWA